MENFVFQNQTKIIFGKQSEKTVGEQIKPYATKILLHYGGGSIKKNGVYDNVVASLKKERIDFVELSGVKPNPRLDLVEKGIKLCRKEGIRFILAVGGGSVIDSSKAIALGVPYEGNVWDFFEGKEIKDALPLGVILTLPAAGSESSKYVVITKEDDSLKKPTGYDNLRPKFAILNPEITKSLPQQQTMIGISDIISHLLERYFTPAKNTDLSDRLIEGTLKTLIHNALVLLETPDDYNARAEVMWAGTVGNNDLFESGRIPDWTCHDLEHEVSAIYDIPHGAGLSIITPAWMRYIYKKSIYRFVNFAYRILDVEPDFDNLENMALEGIDRFEEFLVKLGLPTRLKAFGITDERFTYMAEKCTQKAGTVGNLVKLTKQDIINILKMAL